MGRVGGSKGVVGGEDWGLMMLLCHTLTTESVFVKMKLNPRTRKQTESRTNSQGNTFLK